jgi:hypothetical protein
VLASALRGGALPALETLDMSDNPASEEAWQEVNAALAAVRR